MLSDKTIVKLAKAVSKKFGEDIGQHLAGMVQIRKAVDHRDRRTRGHHIDAFLLECAHHDSFNVPREYACRIFIGLVASQLRCLRSQIECVAAELIHRHLKRNACAR